MFFLHDFHGKIPWDKMAHTKQPAKLRFIGLCPNPTNEMYSLQCFRDKDAFQSIQNHDFRQNSGLK